MQTEKKCPSCSYVSQRHEDVIDEAPHCRMMQVRLGNDLTRDFVLDFTSSFELRLEEDSYVACSTDESPGPPIVGCLDTHVRDNGCVQFEGDHT